MHLHLPRRHRRRLLLPPGLLALAGLLLLGCLALRPWQERLTRRSVLQLTMPVAPKPTDRHPIIRFVVPNADTLRKQYSWHNFKLTGNPENDQLQQQQIATQLQVLLADTMHSNGLRIQLGRTAHYASMIYLLDLTLRKHVPKAWFDITREPTTFYIIQDAHKPPNPSLTIFPYSCLLCGDIMTIPDPLPPIKSFWVRFDDQVTEFWSFIWLRPLQQPEWRWPLILLALLFLLGLRRLLVPKPVARTL